MIMLTIYLIHHIPATRKGVILGISDDPVDPSFRSFYMKKTTRDLVFLMSDFIAKSGVSVAAYTSSIKRQKETCELLFSDTSIPIVIDERLRQIDNGPLYTGMDWDLGSKDYLQFIDKPFPQGESFKDFARRIREFLDEQLKEHIEHTIITVGWRLSPAIFAHVCRGINLEDAIVNNANISGPFTYG